MDTIRVYVGADRSQALAIKVLEHSIRRHTQTPVEVIPMIDLPIPSPRDPQQGQRTGFSFSRFCIPKLAGYTGRAVYMDADMLVMKDMRDLWNIPMNGHKVLIQREVSSADPQLKKAAVPKKRIKQCAVMVLDCARLDWDIEKIVADIDAGKFNYEELVYHLSLLAPEEVGYEVPFEWNSLETLTPQTGNIHYTDMPTQPWVSPHNPNDGIWLEEVAMMLRTGAMKSEEVQREIDLGFMRPSLMADVKYRQQVPAVLLPAWRTALGWFDKCSGYKPHQKVNEEARLRKERAGASPALASA